MPDPAARRRSPRRTGPASALGDLTVPAPAWVVAGAWVVVAVVMLAQDGAGAASPAQVATTLGAAATVLVVAALSRTFGRQAWEVPLSLAAVALAVVTLLEVPGALRAAEDGFYAVKVLVRTPVAPHNVLASLLLAGLGVVLVAARRDARFRPGVLLVVLALTATLSRGAAVACVVLGLAATLDRDTRPFALPLVGTGVLVLGAVTAAGLVLGAGPPGAGPTSVVARTQLWEAGAAAVADAPLTGVGADGFLAFSADRSEVFAPWDHAHDTPLHLLATLGVPAGLVALVPWVALVVLPWRGPPGPTRAALLLAGLALAGHGLVEETATRPAIDLTVGALVGLAAGRGDPERGLPTRRGAAPRRAGPAAQ